MRKHFLTLCLTALLCCIGQMAWAEAGPICAGVLGGTAKDYAYLKWETDNDGNVNITIYPYDKTAETDPAKLTGWRGRGMADNLAATSGWEMTINGEDAVLADYFDKNYTANPSQAAHSTVYQLAIKPGMKALLDGDSVVIKKTTGGNSICWYTPGNSNAYNKYAFEYLYGSSCAGIEAPTNVAITNGVLTFDAVAGAATYKAYYYLGDKPLMSEEITSGTTLVRPMKLGGTYKVAVSAIDANGVESDLSDEVNWVLADQSESSVGSSEYCSYAIGSGTSAATMTWETDADGNVVLSISGDGATWRGTAFVSPANFTVGRVPGSVFFDQVYTTGATTYTLQLKSGAQVALGETITYRGSLQWKTTTNGNAYTLNQVLPYTYGSVCEAAAKPIIDNIAADKTISVTAEGAENLDVNIYLAGDLFAKETVAVGGQLAFKPYLSGKTYQVTVVAKAEGQSDSEESDPYDWTPVPETYSPTASEVCSRQLTGQEGEAANTCVFLSFATDADGHIVATLENAATNTQVAWRDKLTLTGFSMNNGVSLSTFFDESVSGNTYMLTLKDGKEVPYGTVIRYSGNIPWQTAEYTNCYLLDQTIYYTYGSTNCAADEAPVLTASGEVINGTSVRLTMSATDDYASTITYTISYADAEDIVLTGANGATKTQDILGLTDGTEYTFTIVASDGMQTDTKQVVLTPTSDVEAPTNVQVTIVPTGRFSARMTLFADDNVAGDITYAITGEGIVGPVAAAKGTAVSVDLVELTENTNYSYSVVASDAVGNAAEAVVANLTTYSVADNLATGKPATASASEGAHTTDKAVDASETTYWGNYGKVTGKGDSWLVVDLCRTTEVEAINILWQHYPDYAGIGIQGSINGTDWAEIYTSEVKFANNARQVIYFETPVEARYLRVKNEGATQSWYMSIYNFEVFGTANGPVELLEGMNNAAVITALNGETTDISLNRSFVNDGYWYTLCLPFDMTQSQMEAAFGEGYVLAQLQSSEMAGDALTLNFDKVQTIAAGMPYLFKPGQNVAAPILISDVEIDNASTTNTQGIASMVGFYAPTVVPEGNYFLGNGNYLVKNSATNLTPTLAFRAYFSIDLPASESPAILHIAMNEDVTTDIHAQTLPQADCQKIFRDGQILILRDNQVYTLVGQKL